MNTTENPVDDVVNTDHGICARCGVRLFFSEDKVCRPCDIKARAKAKGTS